MTDHTDEIAYLREHYQEMGSLIWRTAPQCQEVLCLAMDRFTTYGYPSAEFLNEVSDFEALAIAKQLLRDRLDGKGPLRVDHGGHTRLDGWHVLIHDVTDGNVLVELHAPTEIEALHRAVQALETPTERTTSDG